METNYNKKKEKKNKTEQQTNMHSHSVKDDCVLIIVEKKAIERRKKNDFYIEQNEGETFNVQKFIADISLFIILF